MKCVLLGGAAGHSLTGKLSKFHRLLYRGKAIYAMFFTVFRFSTSHSTCFPLILTRSISRSFQLYRYHYNHVSSEPSAWGLVDLNLPVYDQTSHTSRKINFSSSFQQFSCLSGSGHQYVSSSSPSPSRDSLPTQVDAIVIGLGGTGLTALLELCLQRNHSPFQSIIGIDQGHVASAAAGRNGGFLLAGIAAFHHEAVRRYGRQPAVEMYRQTLEELKRTFKDSEIGASQQGSFRCAVDEAEVDDCKSQYEALKKDGLPAEWWSPGYRAADVGPGAGVGIGVAGGPGHRGGVFTPADGSFDPVRRARVLAQRVLNHGGKIFTHTPVVSIHPDHVVVKVNSISSSSTSSSSSSSSSTQSESIEHAIRARLIIVAVDGGLEFLLPHIPARTVRLQMLATHPLPHRVCTLPVYRRFGLDYYQQLPDGRLLLGGGRDVGGEGEWVKAGGRAVTTPAVQQYLNGVLNQLVSTHFHLTTSSSPSSTFLSTFASDNSQTQSSSLSSRSFSSSSSASVDHLVSHRWAAGVSMTPTGLPILQRVGGAQGEGGNVWAIGGFNGTGNIIGPLLARSLVLCVPVCIDCFCLVTIMLHSFVWMSRFTSWCQGDPIRRWMFGRRRRRWSTIFSWANRPRSTMQSSRRCKTNQIISLHSSRTIS